MNEDFVRKNTLKGRLLRIVKNKWIIASIVVLAIGGIFYQQRIQTVSGVSEDETYSVTIDTLREELNVSGFVDASEKIDLHFQTAGRLTWVGVREGDEVKKYQGIASLDQRQLQKNIEKYLNNYDKQRRNYEQTTEDNDDGLNDTSSEMREAARRVLENAQYDLNNSVLDVELQTIAKEYSYLYSPIDGIVTRVDAPTAGVNVMPTTVFQVVNKDSIYFSLNVDQTEVVQLQEGMTGAVLIDAFPDREFTGVITAIGFTPKEGEAGTVYEVKIALNSSSLEGLRLGMTGDVSFILSEYPQVLSIPIAYLLPESDNAVVVLVNGKREKRFIELGREVGDKVEVLSGLQEGDVIYLSED